ncbi:MAG TPA: DUF2461 domain-containing protein [Bryobacteraceae bacterium]|jgi:uncharacterized protein (TIGR02453 family)|nr:DUF2461 domain-containing protein [Bryobacteraceae bacterium]
MNPAFAGFPPQAMTFFRGLKKNNTRDWFQPRKEIYDQKVRGPMLELVAALMRRLADFAPDHVGDPKKAIYRIYRDTRFSKNKTPYKTHIAAVFPRRDLEKHGGAGYYFSVSPEEVEVGGGVYMPAPESLRAIREHLLQHHAEFRRIAAAPAVRRLFGEVYGDSLTRVPKGFPADHPAADLLRMKQFLLFKTLDGKLALTPELYRELLTRFEAMTPFLHFLNRPFAGQGRQRLEDGILR